MTQPASSRATRTTMTIICVLAWLALGLQFYLMLENTAGSPVLHTIVNYFSFFTILTNLLVAVTLSCALTAPASAAGRYFGRATVQSAVAVYIAMVGITYSLLLRHMWNPQGAQKIADVLLHDVVPVFYVGFWLNFVPKAGLRWSHAVQWLAFPLVYIAYTLVRGLISHWYPYYFIDVDALGFSQAMTHTAGLLVAFFLLGLLFVAIGRWMTRNSSATAPSR